MENSQHSLTRVRFARTRYTLHYIPARLSSPLLSPPTLGKFFQLGRGIVERGAQVRGSLDC